MKARLIIAMAIGALISMIFLAVPSLRDGTSPWASLELPGMVAALLVWGTHGIGGSDILAMAVMWAVNAAVYSLVALAVVSVLKISN
jgi:hypothetical protein